jgi:hypothetical protein
LEDAGRQLSLQSIKGGVTSLVNHTELPRTITQAFNKKAGDNHVTLVEQMDIIKAWWKLLQTKAQ